jgi:hypothetical protein
MKKLVKIIGVLAILGILGAAYGWFFVYNKPHVNYEKAEPDAVLSAKECYQAFSAENSENLGKVLLLNGVPTAVEQQDSMVIVVFAFNQGMFGDEGIRCTMLPNHNKTALALDFSKEIKIKGKCQGYNGTDVILEHCSIVN